MMCSQQVFAEHCGAPAPGIHVADRSRTRVQHSGRASCPQFGPGALRCGRCSRQRPQGPMAAHAHAWHAATRPRVGPHWVCHPGRPLPHCGRRTLHDMCPLTLGVIQPWTRHATGSGSSTLPPDGGASATAAQLLTVAAADSGRRTQPPDGGASAAAASQNHHLAAAPGRTSGPGTKSET